MQAPRSPRPFAGTFLLYIVGSRTIPARTRREAPRARVHTEHTAKPPDRPDQHTERDPHPCRQHIQLTTS